LTALASIRGAGIPIIAIQRGELADSIYARIGSATVVVITGLVGCVFTITVLASIRCACIAIITIQRD